MRAIKSAYYPRAIRIRKEQYLEIYPQCQVGRSYPVVFSKKLRRSQCAARNR